MSDASTDALVHALLGVVRTLSTGGFSALVEILQDGQPARRVNRPRPVEEVATWAQLCMVLEGGHQLLIKRTWVGVRFEGRAVEGAYVGALVARSQTGTVSPGDGASIQQMVHSAVSTCAVLTSAVSTRMVPPSGEPDAGRQLCAVAVGTR